MFKRTAKQMTAVFTVLVMVMTLLPTLVFSAEPVIIRTPEELAALTKLTSGEKGRLSENYELGNDIDMAGVEISGAIGAIGYGVQPFTGTFDGKGYSICNLTTSANALFAKIEGVVENLTLKGATVHYGGSDSNVAALAGENAGIVRNCIAVDCTVVSDKASPTGGLIGTCLGGTVEKSGVSGGSVTCNGVYGTSQGGLIGNLRGGGMVEQCFANTSVTGQNYWCGGLIGKTENGTVSDCYALGTVTGNTKTGGITGGLASPSVLKNVYSACTVNAASGGALAGSAGGSFDTLGTVENGYYDREKTVPAERTVVPEGEMAMPGAEMQTRTFADCLNNGREIWGQDENINGGYPYLTTAVPPASQPEKETFSVQLLVADYSSNNLSYETLVSPISVDCSETEQSSLTLKEIMERAAAADILSYAEGVGGEAGMVRTIQGVTPKSPGGWMFTVNDISSRVGYSAAQIKNGDRVLWYLGTPENQYKAPTWEEMVNPPKPVKYTEIQTPEMLAALAQTPESWNENYRLTQNLDMSGIDFTPIGNAETPFSGRFDGNGKTIAGLTVTGGKESQNQGMFGVLLGAEIKNLTLEQVSITGGSRVGGLAGYAKADFLSETANLIANCHVSGTVTALGEVFIKQTDAGGLVGYNEGGYDSISYQSAYSAVQGCTAAVTVVGDVGAADPAIAGHVGGLVGWNTGIISDSAAEGDVRGGNTVGGLVGTNGGQIYRSHSNGNVSGAYTVGGFVGNQGMDAFIEACYSTGNVTAIGDCGANYGGFAGAVSRKIKNSISTGILTPGWSYNGGFAGTFEGTVWSWNESLLTLNQCFGNAVTVNGEKIKALGNYLGGLHAPSDAAEEAMGLTKEEADNKLQAMLKTQEADRELAAEVLKYKDAVVIPAAVAEQADVTDLIVKLHENTVADSSVVLGYQGGGYVQAEPDGYILAKKPVGTEQNDVATLELCKDGAKVTKEIAVTLAAEEKEIDVDKLLAEIAAQYEDTADYWEMSGLLAYGKKPEKKAEASYIASAVSAMQESKSDTTLAMYIISLGALGYDSSEITLKDGTKFNAVDKLKEAEVSGVNGDAFRLLALQQKSDYADAQEIQAVIQRLLQAQNANGGWANQGNEGVDPDTTGAVLMALAAYAEENAGVQTALDKAVTYLSGQMLADGNIQSGYAKNNYGTNTNTSAMAVLGLSALGISVDTDPRFVRDGISLWSGLLRFVTSEGDGFVYEYGDKQSDAMATKQGFLAVLAGQKNANVLDFGAVEKRPISLKTTVGGGSRPGGVSGGGAGAPVSEEKISVTFVLTGDQVHGENGHKAYETWIDGKKLTLFPGTNVAEAVKMAMENSGYTCFGLENGYITGIASPDGITLEAYSNGPRSGWMYRVNGKEPTVAMGEYILRDGDVLELYYTDDFSADTEENRYSDVSTEDWFYDAVRFVTEKGLFKGDEKGNFCPEEKLNRAMTAAVLSRISQVDDTNYGKEQRFTDVPVDSWYAGAVNWAAEAQVVNGNGDGTFAPEQLITREQLAAMLYRYAEGKPEECSVISKFSDDDEVSDWAVEAVAWAVEKGLLCGTDENTLEPCGEATRAEAAAVFQRYMNMAA